MLRSLVQAVDVMLLSPFLSTISKYVESLIAAVLQRDLTNLAESRCRVHVPQKQFECVPGLTTFWPLQVRVSAAESRLAHILAGCEAALEGSAVPWATHDLLQAEGDSGGKAAKAEHPRALLVERSRELPLEPGSVVFASLVQRQICMGALIVRVLHCEFVFFYSCSDKCWYTAPDQNTSHRICTLLQHQEESVQIANSRQ